MTGERKLLWSDDRIMAMIEDLVLARGHETYEANAIVIHAMRLEYEAALDAAYDTLAFAAQYTGIEARPCPLCKYEDGVFIEPCGYHQQIDAAQAQLANSAEIAPVQVRPSFSIDYDEEATDDT